jgi:hypothetical protein
MPTIADAGRPVTGGVDTHAEVHVAGMVDQAGADRPHPAAEPEPQPHPQFHDHLT